MHAMFDCCKIKDLLNKGAKLVDVRTYYEFSQGALKDALNMPINSFHYAVEDLDRDDTILLYCRSGARSEMAKNYLKSHGYPNVHNIGSYSLLNNCACE